MAAIGDKLSEMYELAGAQCEGMLTAAAAQRLEQLVLADAELLRSYVVYMHLHAQAELGGAESGQWQSTCCRRVECRELRVESEGELPDSSDSRIATPEIPVINLQIPTLNSRFSTLNSWTLSYSVATVLLAIFLLGAWSYTITHPDADSLATSNSRGATHSRSAEKAPAEFTFVGHVSGMVDCQWSDDATATSPGAAVALNRRYALKAGLMEITYDSGAKVILQGPCEYTVESPRSSFLKVGKLVAKVESRESRVESAKPPAAIPESPNPRTPNPQSLSPLSTLPTPRAPRPSPLFSVRTPTALVEDLGTEFGVEVLESGKTASHVFEGRVVMRVAGAGDEIAKPQTPNPKSQITLSAGQSARVVVGNSDSKKEISLLPDDSAQTRFVRSLPALLICSHKLGITGEFVAAKDDLINVGQPTLAKIELSSGEAMHEGRVEKLVDGDVYGSETPMSTRAAFTAAEGAAITVALNTILHPNGYNIHKIAVLTGCEGGDGNQDRSSQKYDLAYSTVAAPDEFIPLQCDKAATVDRNAQGWKEMQTTLSRGKQVPIACGVAKLRFTFHATQSADPESVYREIDVFGAPTLEEVKQSPENRNRKEPKAKP
jgi:hypothetical protein